MGKKMHQTKMNQLPDSDTSMQNKTKASVRYLFAASITYNTRIESKEGNRIDSHEETKNKKQKAIPLTWLFIPLFGVWMNSRIEYDGTVMTFL
jgi:hypothetical protein